MNDFAQKVSTATDLTQEEQKKAGAPVAGIIADEYRDFLKVIKGMLERKEIDPLDPKSLLNMDVYNALDEEWQDKADLALTNVADQLRHIADFLASPETPNESPQLETMIMQLWQSKQQIEQHHDIFKF